VRAPRWYEPRFAGTLVRPRIPPGFFEALAHRVETEGLTTAAGREPDRYRVVDASDAPVASGYRVAGGAGPSIHVRAATARAAKSALEDVYVWQQGPHTLDYRVEFRELAWSRVVVFLAFAVPGAFAGFWLLVLHAAPPRVLVSLLPLVWVAFAVLILGEMAIEVRMARRSLERAFDETIGNAGEPAECVRVVEGDSSGDAAGEAAEGGPAPRAATRAGGA